MFVCLFVCLMLLTAIIIAAWQQITSRLAGGLADLGDGAAGGPGSGWGGRLGSNGCLCPA